MLRLWPEPVRVGIFPERVLACCDGAGWRRTAPARCAVALPGGRLEAAQLVPRIIEAIEGLDLTRVGGVSVLLSNHFVRYQLLPSSDALVTQADWLAFAGHKFGKAHGDEAASWDIRVAAAGAGVSRVASAIPPGLHEGLRLGLKAAGLRLASLQPALMASVERMKPLLKHQEAAWLVAHEPGIVALGYVVGERWQALRLRKVGDDWLEALPQLLAREVQLLGLAEAAPALLLDAPCLAEVPTRIGDHAVLNPGNALSAADDRASGHALLLGVR